MSQTGAVFARLMSSYPLSKLSYCALLQLALETQMMDWLSDDIIQNISDLDSVQVQNIAFFEAIICALGNRRQDTNPAVVRGLLKEIANLVRSHHSFAETFKQIPGWQEQLTKLVVTSDALSSPVLETLSGTQHPTDRIIQQTRTTVEVTSPQSEGVNSVFNDRNQLNTYTKDSSEFDDKIPINSESSLDIEIIELISLIISKHFDTDKRAWKYVEESMTYFGLLESRAQCNSIYLTRLMLTSNLKSISQQISLGDPSIFSATKLVIFKQ
jgi:hypothetical protein